MVLVPAQDEGHRTHHPEVHPPGDLPRVRRHLTDGEGEREEERVAKVGLLFFLVLNLFVLRFLMYRVQLENTLFLST